MRWLVTILFSAMVAVPGPNSPSKTDGPQAFQRGGCTWVWMRPGSPLHWEGYDLHEEFNPKTYVRTDYLKVPGDSKPVLFYTHGRGIEITLGHKHRLVLIEDDYASKGTRVMVVDLKARRQWEIDKDSDNRFKTDTSPGPRLIVEPIPYALSPDDAEALIKMQLIWVSVPTGELVGQVTKTYHVRWYAVESASGKVLREFRRKEFPQHWWNSVS